MQNKIAELEKNLNAETLLLWRLIQIDPVKWSTPTGEAWVVGIMGQKVIWYNADEGRLMVSDYKVIGRIEATAGKIAQSDVPDNMLALLTALHAITGPIPS